MSGLLNIAQGLQPFDLGQSLGRIDQIQGNALALMMQKRQAQEAEAYQQALQSGGAALAGSDPAARQNALAALLRSGARGAAQALPLLQQERENAEFRALLSGEGFGAVPAAAPAPAPMQASGSLPVPVGRTSASTVPAGRLMQPPEWASPIIAEWSQRTGLPPALGISLIQNESGFRDVSGPAIPGRSERAQGDAQVLPSTARDPGYGMQPLPANATREDRLRFGLDYAAARIKATGGDVRQGLLGYGGGASYPADRIMERAGVGSGQSAPPAGSALPSPPARPPTGLTPDRLFAMAASGNPRAMEFARTMAPLMARENPNFQITTIGGQAVAVNPQNPNQRIVLGSAEAPDRTLVEIRRPDGATVMVPRDQAAGMVSAPAPSNETVLVPDPNSATGFRYVSKAEAARVGMPAPAPEGYRPERTTSTVAVLKRDAQGNDLPGTSELVSTGDSVGRTPASNKEDPSFERTRGLRNDFQAIQPVKDYLAVLPQVQSIRAAANTNTAAADLNIVFAFAKLLDPTSVVREGEADSIVKTGGIFDTLAAQVNRIQGGARLSPGVRADLLEQAESRFKIFADNYDGYAQRYRTLAEQSNLNPDQVALPVARPAAQERTGTNPPPSGATPPGPSAELPPPANPPAANSGRPPNGWTVRDLRNLPENDFRALATNTGSLSPQEKLALTAELTRRANRMGSNDGR